MDTNPIETDDLAVGAGAAAMAFVDTLLAPLNYRSSWRIGTTALAAAAAAKLPALIGVGPLGRTMIRPLI